MSFTHFHSFLSFKFCVFTVVCMYLYGCTETTPTQKPSASPSSTSTTSTPKALPPSSYSTTSGYNPYKPQADPLAALYGHTQKRLNHFAIYTCVYISIYV